MSVPPLNLRTLQLGQAAVKARQRDPIACKVQKILRKIDGFGVTCDGFTQE